jgi:Universal stress protein family
MIRHILVPFDFSPHATDAFRFALTPARKSGALHSALVNGNLTGDIIEHASLPIWTFLITR